MSWEITGNSGINPNVNFLGTTDEQPLVVKTNGQEVLRFDSLGKIGIGTPNPTSKLEIVAQDGLLIHGFQPFLTLKDSNSNARTRIQTANGDIGFQTEAGIDSGSFIPAMKILNSGTVQIAGQDALQIFGFQPFLTLLDTNSNARTRIQTANGDIGFQTEAGIASGSFIPAMKILNSGTVQIAGQDALQIFGFQPFLTLLDTNSNARARIQTANGDIGFQTEAGIASGSFVPAMKILNSGDVEFSGDIRLINAADCAEDFDIVCIEKVEPGTVMVIDSEGALKLSDQAYDKRVAGVISGAGNYKPGLTLDKQASSNNRMPIALMGKVYCKVDASYGAIEVGDLLTTSPFPGHAMKATDPLKSFGSVIGKALRPLEAGQSLIPILIALQ
jgi:ligand-binding sensor protein